MGRSQSKLSFFSSTPGWWSDGRFRDKLYHGLSFPFLSMFLPWRPSHSSSPHGHCGRNDVYLQCCSLPQMMNLYQWKLCHHWVGSYSLIGKFFVVVQQICTGMDSSNWSININLQQTHGSPLTSLEMNCLLGYIQTAANCGSNPNYFLFCFFAHMWPVSYLLKTA